jgi:hypothetical protein
VTWKVPTQKYFAIMVILFSAWVSGLSYIELIILVMLGPGAAGTIGDPGIIDGEPVPAVGRDIEHGLFKRGDYRVAGQENGLVIASIGRELALSALGLPYPLG